MYKRHLTRTKVGSTEGVSNKVVRTNALAPKKEEVINRLQTVSRNRANPFSKIS